MSRGGSFLASVEAIGINPGFADGVGSSVHVDHNYATACGWGINSGNLTGFGTTSAVAGTSSFDDNQIEETEFECILVAMSYAQLEIAGNTLTNCDRQPGSANGALDLQALAPPTAVTATGNVITRATPTTAGSVGILIQNVPASAGNLASFHVEGNAVTGLTALSTSDGVRLGPTAIARAAADVAEPAP